MRACGILLHSCIVILSFTLSNNLVRNSGYSSFILLITYLFHMLITIYQYGYVFHQSCLFKIVSRTTYWSIRRPVRSWSYTICLFTLLISYHTMQGGSARQTDEYNHNELIAGRIRMSEISYPWGLRLPIKGLWSAVWKRGFFRRINNTFLPHYFSYILRTLQYNSYTGIFYISIVAHLSGSLCYFLFDFYLVQMY